MDPVSPTHDIQRAGAALAQIESRLTHGSLADLTSAADDLEQLRTVLEQALPVSREIPDREHWLELLADLQQRAARVNALLDGAGAFHRGWASLAASDCGYAPGGTQNGAVAVIASDGPQCIRTVG